MTDAHALRCWLATNDNGVDIVSNSSRFTACAASLAAPLHEQPSPTACAGLTTATGVRLSPQSVLCARAEPGAGVRAVALESVHTTGRHIAARCLSSAVVTSVATDAAAAATTSAASETLLATPQPCTCATPSTYRASAPLAAYRAASPVVDEFTTALCNLQIDGVWWCEAVGGTSCGGALRLDGHAVRAARPCGTGSVPGWSASAATDDENNNATATAACAAACVGGLGCNAAGACVCPLGYTGDNCTQPVCTDPACDLSTGTCTAPETCTCGAGFEGAACDAPACATDCSGHGVCIATDTCTCLAGYEGAACEREANDDGDGEEDDDDDEEEEGSTAAAVTLGLGATVAVMVVLLLLLYRATLSKPIVIVQAAPEGAELGPLITQTVTTKRCMLGIVYTTERTQDFYVNASLDVNSRAAGLLPSYEQSVSRSASVSAVGFASRPGSRSRVHPAGSPSRTLRLSVSQGSGLGEALRLDPPGLVRRSSLVSQTRFPLHEPDSHDTGDDTASAAPRMTTGEDGQSVGSAGATPPPAYDELEAALVQAARQSRVAARRAARRRSRVLSAWSDDQQESQGHSPRDDQHEPQRYSDRYEPSVPVTRWQPEDAGGDADASLISLPERRWQPEITIGEAEPGMATAAAQTAHGLDVLEVDDRDAMSLSVGQPFGHGSRSAHMPSGLPRRGAVRSDGEGERRGPNGVAWLVRAMRPLAMPSHSAVARLSSSGSGSGSGSVPVAASASASASNPFSVSVSASAAATSTPASTSTSASLPVAPSAPAPAWVSVRDRDEQEMGHDDDDSIIPRRSIVSPVLRVPARALPLRFSGPPRPQQLPLLETAAAHLRNRTPLEQEDTGAERDASAETSLNGTSENERDTASPTDLDADSAFGSLR